MGYYNAVGKNVNSYVNYKVLDKDGGLVADAGNQPCFRTWMLYGSIRNTAKFMVIYRNLSMIPYDKEAIMWFTLELNHMGFPILVELDRIDPTMVNWIIPLDQYTKKLHVKATMTMTRCLWELGICVIADTFFSIREKEPDLDPFIAIQRAHKLRTGWACGHQACTADKTSPDVTRETFFKRMEAATKGVYDDGFQGYDELSKLFLNGDHDGATKKEIAKMEKLVPADYPNAPGDDF